VLTAVVAAALTMLGLWWARDRRMVIQRQQMRTLHALSEDILAATSPTEILKMLRQVLIPLYDLSAVRLYIADRNASQLDMVPSLENPRTESISLESPDSASGPALCFRNRTLLAIPDTRRTPFGAGEHEMRSVMFIPMFARKELAGVLELARSGRAHAFTVDEQTAAQHVANQVAMAIRLLDQQSIREQLFRSEKLAAAGKLTSAVANELREPLDSISRLSAHLSSSLKGSSEEADIRSVGMEARRASDIVARLVSFARPEEAEAGPVELHPLLSGLIEFRQHEGAAQAVKFQARLAADSLVVLGSQGQLEQVFLDLLVHAEQSAGESVEKTVFVSTSRAADRALIEIVYTTGPEEPGQDPFADGRPAESGALGLDMCRGIVQSHGGEIRTVPGAGEARFVVELPLQETPANLQQAAAATALPGRSLTVLIVESDLQVQRQLLGMISSRGHRVVPVGSAEEGADLIERLRFDFVLCAVKLPGLNWVEFFERVRRHIGGFALLTDGYDADLSRAFAEGEGHILAKPVEEFQLCRLLDGAAFEQTTSARK
jgi:signal transduction histidine kinase